MLRNNVSSEECALFGCRHRSQSLFYGKDIVVDSFGQPNHRQLVVVFVQVCGQIRSGSVGIVTADGVEDIDLVLR